MKVLVACEESQTVCKAFRERGHEAYSCDIQEPSGGHPEWHILGDAVEALRGGRIETMDGTAHYVDKWDMLIAHPPCTYISNAGVRFLYPNGEGKLNEERLRKGIEATHFFLRFLYADIERIAVENPIPSTVYMLPKYTQIVQPWQFGHPVQKKTCLWLKGLPKLVPTKICEERQSSKVAGNWFNHGGKERQKNRAKTFKGIADAMADQWGNTGLRDLPTIDAVPVVRCVDCKHRPTKRMGRSGRYLDFPDYKCPFQCDDPWYNREPPDDWFCPKGERGAKNETD